MKSPSNGAPRIPRARQYAPAWAGEYPLSRGDRLILTAMCFVVALALAVAAAYAVRIWLGQAPPVPAPTVPVEFTCPAPTRPGEVTSIFFQNDGGKIKTYCRLTRDWQLLNPRGQNIPTLPGGSTP